MVLNLERRVNYSIPLAAMFRESLTPQEIITMRENTHDIAKLRDLFGLVVSLDKGRVQLPEVTSLEVSSMREFGERAALEPEGRRMLFPYVDRVNPNRLNYSRLHLQLGLPFPVQLAQLEGRPYMRLEIKGLVQVLTSSVNGHEPIYMVNDAKSNYRLFFMAADKFRESKLELHMFCRLCFSNVIYRETRPLQALWVPQFLLSDVEEETLELKKRIFRLTDFSVAMGKSMWLSEDHGFCSKQFLPPALRYRKAGSDASLGLPMLVGYFNKKHDEALGYQPVWARLVEAEDIYKP